MYNFFAYVILNATVNFACPLPQKTGCGQQQRKKGVGYGNKTLKAKIILWLVDKSKLFRNDEEKR